MSWKNDDRTEIALEWIAIGAGIAATGMALATAYFEMKRARFELAKSMLIEVEMEDEEADAD